MQKDLKRKNVTLSCNSLLRSWTAFQLLGQKDLLTSNQLKTEWILSSLNAWQMRATRVSKTCPNFFPWTATVEKGFNVNKEVEGENLKEHTLVAQRIVCDHVNSVGGVLKVEFRKPLLLSVKMSRHWY